MSYLMAGRAGNWTVHLFIVSLLSIIILELIKPDFVMHEEAGCHFSGKTRKQNKCRKIGIYQGYQTSRTNLAQQQQILLPSPLGLSPVAIHYPPPHKKGLSKLDPLRTNGSLLLGCLLWFALKMLLRIIFRKAV